MIEDIVAFYAEHIRRLQNPDVNPYGNSESFFVILGTVAILGLIFIPLLTAALRLCLNL